MHARLTDQRAARGVTGEKKRSSASVNPVSRESTAGLSIHLVYTYNDLS